MKKNNTQSIGEVIEQYLKALKIDGKMKEARILDQWDKIVGKTIAKTTRDLYIKNRVLYIHLN
jgi:predicted nucleic acid-binding Zn ribbon protein